MLAAAACGSRPDVRTSVNPAADFTGRDTYAWTDGSDVGATEADRALEEELREAAEHELAAKGFRRAADAPRLLLERGAVVLRRRRDAGDEEYTGIWTEDYEPNVPGGAGGGDSYYHVGKLFLRALDPESRELLWTANAETELSPHSPLELRRTRVRGAVRKMLADFPPSK